MKRIVLASLVLAFSLSANANQLSIDDQINNACAKALSGDKEPLGDFPQIVMLQQSVRKLKMLTTKF